MGAKTVIVNGAFGKMGAITAETVNQSEKFELVASLGVKDDLSASIQLHQPDIVIDFTNADVAYENAKIILDHNVSAVIGTSGLTDEQIKRFSTQCELQKLGVIIAPNFSLGAILMMKCAAMIAPHLQDVEIIETHHAAKIDAPSGTAKKTAALIAEHRGDYQITDERSQSARGEDIAGVPVHALRLPGYIASQSVMFGGMDENLSITHHSISRKSFMPGVLLALSKVSQLNHLVYGLDQLI